MSYYTQPGFYRAMLGISEFDGDINSNQINTQNITTQNITVSSLGSGLVSSNSGVLQNSLIGAGLDYDPRNNTLSNQGVTSLISGATGPLILSNSTGDLEISLPQNITTSSSPQFARLLNSSLGTFSVIQGTNAGNLFTGDRCVLIGDSVMAATSASQQSTAVGNSALGFASGNFNTAVGANAGFAVTTGTINTIVGTDAGRGTTPLTTGSGNVLLGAGANTSSSSSSNEIVLGFGVGSGSNTAKIYASNGLNVSNLTNGVLKATSGTITSNATTDDLAEGKTNLYFTNARAQGAFSGVAPISISSSAVSLGYNTSNLKLTGSNLDTIQDIQTISSPTFAGLTLGSLSGVLKASAGVINGSSTTDDLPEGKTNVYFTVPRARSAFIAIAPIYINTGIIYLGYNTTNLTLTGADLNTIQDISTSSSPQFARLLNSSIGSTNILIGNNSGINMTTAGGNTLIGQGAGAGITTGTFNLAIGNSAMGGSGGMTESSAQNIAIGNSALFSCASTANQNIAIGYSTLQTLNTGRGNVCMGNSTANSLTTGINNTCIGNSAGFSMQTASFNTLIGQSTSFILNNGQFNTCVGYLAGQSLISGSNNLHLGYNTRASSSTVSNEIVIGNSTTITQGKGANTAFINAPSGLYSFIPGYWWGSSQYVVGGIFGWNTFLNRGIVRNPSDSTQIICPAPGLYEFTLSGSIFSNLVTNQNVSMFVNGNLYLTTPVNYSGLIGWRAISLSVFVDVYNTTTYIQYSMSPGLETSLSFPTILTAKFISIL